MKFKDLPLDVQVIAAQTLSGKFCESGLATQGKTEPAKKLAREVRDAFTELYSEFVASPRQSDPKEE
ncbi:formyltetrahydrofolate deformylase [Serratia fonticola]|uniref:formyltetrahydrofolate deformylase n=1 Tax=Serratia fonticola TaxID=47917 RepID=UPI0021BD42F2|nr:formyltetrahydrofolate deformylase [Serratia fonticola]